MWSVVGTWPFSLQLTEKASGMLAQGAKALDALEAGVHLVESDPNVDSVGRGGYLNANGELELDAAMMDGDTLRMGCVAGVRGFEHPVSIARKVMEETVHSIIVGEGAEAFARKMGIPEVGNEYMVTEAARKAWELKKREGHDTIGAVALDTWLHGHRHVHQRRQYEGPRPWGRYAHHRQRILCGVRCGRRGRNGPGRGHHAYLPGIPGGGTDAPRHGSEGGS